MPTSSNQKKFGATANQRTFTNTVAASTVGTLIPQAPDLTRITQSGGYRIIQSGEFRIING
jgi:hypothetical protein